MSKIRPIARARDIRTERQLIEVQEQSDQPAPHASTHEGGEDPVSPGGIGAETPSGAQDKVDTHEGKDNPHSNSASNTDLNSHTSSNNPHSGSQPRQGGTTSNRPDSPANYEFYFDEDLSKPIWYDPTQSDWVDATGTVV